MDVSKELMIMTPGYLGSIVFKLFLSVLLSGLIGWERQAKHLPAGFRTYILVCVGSTLIMMISRFMIDIDINFDAARLGAQVISGIGFLGAGTIIRDGANVRGITTAASLWAVACVGLSIGIGFYAGAVLTAITMLLVLHVLGGFKDRRREDGEVSFVLSLRNEADAIAELFATLHKACKDIRQIEFNENGEGMLEVVMAVNLRKGTTRTDLMGELLQLPGMMKVEE